MTTGRLDAVRASNFRTIREIERPRDSLGNPLPVSEYFGSNVFGIDQLQEKLSKDSFEKLTALVDRGVKIPKEAANEVAAVVKDWAVSQGATHFCHYFQPMTGLTAEKHDALIETKTSDRGQTSVIERLTGASFMQQEPDASSFPSGGMRTTFEARGYTTWDPLSPLFIIESVNGKTLCVSSAFISYNGHALDMKTPLMRSIQKVSDTATRFLKLIGDVDVKKIKVTLGAEQEYFLIDRAFFTQRPDLVMTGRTLVGRISSRNQQFEDHYFGSIPARALAFMHELEQEMYKLGVPLKTRHNEVAPSQFEVAPIFENANLSVDHNTLLMDIIRKIAKRHNYEALLHEKPFDGVNGSGKHCNWSIETDRGDNLLDPGRTPHQSLRFLTVLCAVLKAVHDHAGVIRAGIASSGNDHRLGANEAPPAIISVFLGQTLTDILDRIEKGETIQDSPEEAVIGLGVSSLPVVARDNTDRNRTSPFAFTGNKFEFRAVGSSTNTSVPLTFLNAAVADSFNQLADRLEKKLADGEKRDAAVLSLIKEVITETKAIRFEGNNYDEAWVKEAEKRGLPHYRNTASALSVLHEKKSSSFLIEQNVLSAEELESRFNIMVERYNKQIEMEASTLIELVDTFVLPATEKELSGRASLIDRLDEIKSTKAKSAASGRLSRIESLYIELCNLREELVVQVSEIGKTAEDLSRSNFLSTQVIPLMQKIRSCSDLIEGEVTDENWTLPKYREILFLS